jgi:hypothetical protein
VDGPVGSLTFRTAVLGDDRQIWCPPGDSERERGCWIHHLPAREGSLCTHICRSSCTGYFQGSSLRR